VLVSLLVVAPIPDENIQDMVGLTAIVVGILLFWRAAKRKRTWKAEQRFVSECHNQASGEAGPEEIVKAFRHLVEVLETEPWLVKPIQTVEEALGEARVQMVAEGVDVAAVLRALRQAGLVHTEQTLLRSRLSDLVCELAREQLGTDEESDHREGSSRVASQADTEE